MPRNPLDYAPRDLSICLYVGLYRIGILAILQIVFAGFGNCGSAIRRLSQPATAESREQPPLIRSSKSLPKGRGYVQLSSAGCRRFSVSPALAAPLGKAALDLATAISFACAFSVTEWHRVLRSELTPLLGNDAPPDNVAHVVVAATSAHTAPAILRVYHAVSDIQTSVQHLTRLKEEASRKRLLGEWLKAGDYGFAVLCPTTSAVSITRQALERCAVLRGVNIQVVLGPTTDTLDEALRGAKA